MLICSKFAPENTKKLKVFGPKIAYLTAENKMFSEISLKYISKGSFNHYA